MSNKRTLLQWAGDFFDPKTYELIQGYAERQKRLSPYRMFTRTGAIVEFSVIFEFYQLKTDNLRNVKIVW